MATKQPLGTFDLQVAPWALGGNVFGWTIEPDQSFQVLDAFVDRGFDLIDTANVYSTWASGNQGGESETVIGNWLKQSGKRDEVILATKVGMEMGDGSRGLKKENILKSVDDSLQRLQTDHIDLYQSHCDDSDVPLEETLAAYDQLMRTGKIRAIGASNFDAARLRQSLTLAEENNFPMYVSLQPEYNLYDREGYEAELEPLCLEKKLGVIPYYSLASGFLTGKYRSEQDLGKSKRGQSVGNKYMNERGERILKALDQVADEHDTVPAVIAMAWLMQRDSITAPIASATSVQQVEELAKSTEIELTIPQIQQLNLASAYEGMPSR